MTHRTDLEPPQIGWVMCYFDNPAAAGLTDPACSELLSDLENGGNVYSDSNSFLTSGGVFGCEGHRSNDPVVADRWHCQDDNATHIRAISNADTGAYLTVCLNFP